MTIQSIFHPFLGLEHAKAQTVFGYTLPISPFIDNNSTHKILTPEGDKLLVHLHTPPNYKRLIIIVHGFTGCSQSKYSLRLTKRLVKNQFAVLRVNLRGAGESTYTCRRLYHAGKTEDIKLILNWAAQTLPNTPITLVGYSLGGNVSLKTGAEDIPENIPLTNIITISTPLELKACTLLLMQPQNKIFNQHFVTRIINETKALHYYHQEVDFPDFSNVKSVYEFDEVYTAPINHFKNADEYYHKSSSFNYLEDLKYPTLLIHSLDDPFICKKSYLNLPKNKNISTLITMLGGHLGWLGNPFKGPFRWMDQQIFNAITQFHDHQRFPHYD